jgi:hypothetical protein
MPPSIRIGETELSFVKENVYKIETSKLILDSITDNMEQRNIDINISIHTSTSVKKREHSHAHAYAHGNIEAQIKASSVMPLTKFLLKKENKHGVSFDIILHFIGNIGNQLTFLKNQGFSIPFFSLEDIIVIDEIVFAFVNNDKVFKMESDSMSRQSNTITIDYPILYDAHTSFIPPNIGFQDSYRSEHGEHSEHGSRDHEMKLPIHIHFSAAFYSLAQICVYVFLRKKIKTEEDYEKEASPFIYTSLYWCLKRCLDKDENRRILLYV